MASLVYFNKGLSVLRLVKTLEVQDQIPAQSDIYTYSAEVSNMVVPEISRAVFRTDQDAGNCYNKNLHCVASIDIGQLLSSEHLDGLFYYKCPFNTCFSYGCCGKKLHCRVVPPG